ncbi:hypothetical protein [Brevundimonas sp. Root1423]|uniref:hypothetical protein n=1 Tax=Brevundimonas sp. Root1423 TaxID=1736462 RepID=UPI0006FF8E83|nr:hypothetical protein [Brevundimonas sp. Root1423]KQY89822.1 hypothetical protein ASD25_04645 [Brevundimonas sp. Root1423]
MKYQAIITIDFEDSDAFGVQARRNILSALVRHLSAEHGEAQLQIKARRPRTAARAAPPPKLGDEFEIVRARYAG